MSNVIGHRKRILSLDINIISYVAAIEQIILLGLSKKPSYVCFANVHMVIEAKKNEQFSRLVNNSSLVLADGVPLVKSLKLLYNETQGRIAGMDVFPDLLASASERGLRVFFFGTTNEVLTKISQKAKLEYPDLDIVGFLSPPFDKPINDPEYVDVIVNSKADLVFVALGCPKQEIWMSKNFASINATLLGVGGAFPVYAGKVKRAPVFLQRIGLEWMFRLLQEPKRLFKRYLKTNSLFLFLIFKEKLLGQRRI